MLELHAVSSTEPVRSLDNDPGLMTFPEYMKWQNDEGKWHPDSAYNESVETMNSAPVESFRAYSNNRNQDEIVVLKSPTGFLIKREDDKSILCVILGDVLYHTLKTPLSIIPNWYYPYYRGSNESIKLEYSSTRQVKYLDDYVSKFYGIAEYNREKLPILMQRIKVAGEPMEIRASDSNRLNGNPDAVYVLNKDGMKVAQASDEWGATLVMVAREYRNKGLGRILGSLWAKMHPNMLSGGYTTSGRHLAAGLWADRVREYAEKGWYTELVRAGKLTTSRVKEIISGLKGINRAKSGEANPSAEKPQPKILIYVDDTAFVVYDAKFIADQDPDFILGQGFIRVAPDNEDADFFYALDFEPSFKKLVTTVAMQFMYDSKRPLYIESPPSDTMELDEVENLSIQDGYAQLTKPALNLKLAAQTEKRTRKPFDRYDEIRNGLLEAAQFKWRRR